ncbi:uncharacterized protein AMSG_02597 [Thecamonas trahens ATCC 50062]|uniref:Uncharacterized protein n=1 Tax=Thecamonas trahens ATCC 50062 TaxID=461836 RepID=A0A0L0D5D6_THETB|nr:hypothetical protein AMSG_02597 [Thecamonas trahens ATCC 50062]KNC47572.1 hypothetical protein AMSG_02597 [Thecamonas trahens ATCC 50062]|eukprot:XP_013759504.1 hypothetical protein AMSG_02597 [Thecamonas trahens ATCC 50062]
MAVCTELAGGTAAGAGGSNGSRPRGKRRYPFGGFSPRAAKVTKVDTETVAERTMERMRLGGHLQSLDHSQPGLPQPFRVRNLITKRMAAPFVIPSHHRAAGSFGSSLPAHAERPLASSAHSSSLFGSPGSLSSSSASSSSSLLHGQHGGEAEAGPSASASASAYTPTLYQMFGVEPRAGAAAALGRGCGDDGGLAEMEGVSAQVACYICEKTESAVGCARCGYAVCPACMRQCDLCADSFCDVCVIVNYDQRYDRIFCLSCSDESAAASASASVGPLRLPHEFTPVSSAPPRALRSSPPQVSLDNYFGHAS